MDDLALLRRHEPVLRFNAAEHFLPCAVEPYVERSSLVLTDREGEPQVIVPRGELDIDRLARIGRERAGAALEMQFVEQPLGFVEYRRWHHEIARTRRMSQSDRFLQVGVMARFIEAAFRLSVLVRGHVSRRHVAAGEVEYREHVAPHGTPYYGRVVREAGWTILQYWYFYAMNDWRSSFRGINNHEADWEMMMIALSPGRAGELEPRWIAFSSHDYEGDELRRRVDDPGLEWHDGHIVAYPGAGSHKHSPVKMDEVVSVEPPVLRRTVRALRTVAAVVTPWGDRKKMKDGFSIPFVDYHRGDGVAIGPGGDTAWTPVLIDDDTPWVRDYRGRWGLDTNDRFGGESAPTGPRHESTGVDRVRWEDPLGWAGMHKVDPDPEAARRSADERLRDIDDRILAIDEEMEGVRTRARIEWTAARTMPPDTDAATVGRERRAVAAGHDAAMTTLRDERRRLDAERTSLVMAIEDGLTADDPRAHLSPTSHALHDVDDEMADMSPVQRQALRVWSAIATPWLLGVLVWLLAGYEFDWYWWGVAIGVGGFLLMESLVRGRILAFIATVVVIAALVAEFVYDWRYTVAAVVAAAAVVLLVQNLRELRHG